jgi:hypothetical protein
LGDNVGGARVDELEQGRNLFDVAGVNVAALAGQHPRDDVQSAVVSPAPRRRQRLDGGDVLFDDL